MIADADVVLLLRRLNRPHLLSRSHLARAISRALPAPSVRDSVVRALTDAFATAPEDARPGALRDFVFRYDVARCVPRATASRESGLSRRTFGRLHARAVRLIAAYLGVLLSDCGVRELVALGDRPNAVAAPAARKSRAGSNRTTRALERCRSSFEEHAARGDAVAMKASLASMHGYCAGATHQQAIELAVMRARMDLFRGRLQHASGAARELAHALRESWCERQWLGLLQMSAELAYAVGNAGHANELASIVQTRATQRSDIHQAATILRGRIALSTGQAWDRGGTLRTTGLRPLWLDAIEARDALRAGRRDRAAQLSSGVLTTARQHGYVPLASWTAATLAACEQDPSARSNHFVLDALRSFLAASASPYLACDLFAFDAAASGAPIDWSDGTFYDHLAELYVRLCPESPFAAQVHARAALPAVLRELIAFARRPSTFAYRSSPAVRDLHDDACVAALAAEGKQLARFADFVKVVVPAHRQPAFVLSFRNAAAAVVRALVRERSFQLVRERTALTTVGFAVLA